jgi:hypothetical protein
MDVESGVASQVGNGDHEVESFALDTLLQDVPLSFIKDGHRGIGTCYSKGNAGPNSEKRSIPHHLRPSSPGPSLEYSSVHP